MAAPQAQLERSGVDHSPREPLLIARNIRKAFGHVQALSDAYIDVCAGEIVALVGDNGAGKSTLIKVLSGAHRPDAGEIIVRGQSAAINNPNDSFDLGIATVYQDLALLPSRDVVANLYVGRELTNRGILDRRKMIEEANRVVRQLRTNLPSVHTPVRFLSGGQRQAVAIARVVHFGAEILLLDEPTAALGVKEAHEMLTLIENLKEQNKGIIVVSHNLAHVFRICDRITVLRHGETVGTLVKEETNSTEVVRLITGADLL
ncbi:MAG: ATP-binding cassette domain-containing protein [Chloroflexi bacterium]|nr:ATP-binding cassette domain-containing protein [Chloroflexota bacterium]MYE26652.1 sugar ABC transporter ATP-binding protein [Chloroflexota bacterium]